MENIYGTLALYGKFMYMIVSFVIYNFMLFKKLYRYQKAK